jgi:hypothetical protein
MDGSKLVRKVRDWIPSGRENFGKPKLKWKDTVKQED